MGSFGENLRREREMRGISLEEISQATRIGVRMFEALEKERFERLPGGVFNRSFVRQYSRYLGLDEERVVAEFELACGGTDSLDFKRLATTAAGAPGWGTEPAEEEEPRSYQGRVFAVLLVAAVLSFAGWRLWTAYAGRWMLSLASQAPAPPPRAKPAAPAEASSQQPATAPPEGAGVGTPAAGTEGPSPAGARPGAGGPALPSPASPPAPAEPGLRLQVDAMERSWVAVYADGRKAWEAVLEPGASRTATASRSVELRAGNAAALVLTLNGETLSPLGRKGEVKTVTYSVDDLRKHSTAEKRP